MVVRVGSLEEGERERGRKNDSIFKELCVCMLCVWYCTCAGVILPTIFPVGADEATPRTPAVSSAMILSTSRSASP